jgi:hypothetical protein
MLPVFSKPLEAVTPDDIQLLITEAYPENSLPYTFFLLNDDMKLNRNWQFLI